MLLEKFILFFVLFFVFICPKLLYSSLPENFGILPSKTHPIDLLIDKHILQLNQKDLSFETSSFDRYSGGYLIRPYTIFAYSTLQRENIANAEADFCNVFEKVINIYNRIPEIRPYLKVFPISTKELDVWLYYRSAQKTYQQPPYFCLVYIPYADLEFRKWTDPQQPSLTLLPIFYKKDYTSIPGLKKYLEASIPREKNRLKKSLIADKDFERFEPNIYDGYFYPIINKLRSKYNLHISTLKRAALEPSPYREIAAGFWAQNKNMPLDEAKKFSREFISDFLWIIRNKRLIEKNNRKDDPVLKDLQQNLNWFCFRITFWDESLNRVEEPYIAQIQCQDGKILYFTADEGQRLRQIFEEPIPEQFFPKKSEQQ